MNTLIIATRSLLALFLLLGSLNWPFQSQASSGDGKIHFKGSLHFPETQRGRLIFGELSFDPNDPSRFKRATATVYVEGSDSAHISDGLIDCYRDSHKVIYRFFSFERSEDKEFQSGCRESVFRIYMEDPPYKDPFSDDSDPPYGLGAICYTDLEESLEFVVEQYWD